MIKQQIILRNQNKGEEEKEESDAKLAKGGNLTRCLNCFKVSFVMTCLLQRI